VIQRVIDGRLTFSPFGSAKAAATTLLVGGDSIRLFSGCYLQVPAWVVAHDAALNEVFDTMDTRDADYNKLQEKVNGKRLASPVCASWNQLNLWIRAMDGLRRAA